MTRSTSTGYDFLETRDIEYLKWGYETPGSETTRRAHVFASQVHFQLIYVYRGWVDLVYEDQGPPFRLEAGCCVTQPPLIRHKVLVSSDDLHVIEIGVPAEVRPEEICGSNTFERSPTRHLALAAHADDFCALLVCSCSHTHTHTHTHST